MSDASISVAKKRGRPATGVGTMIGVRLQPEQLADLDRWIEKNAGLGLSRPQAIRRLLNMGMHADPDFPMQLKPAR
ncbi:MULTISPECIES: hypothetical protein [unclassified Sphingomonas]|uniref:hypothetical protein n=1 Tax=unclassified Sphingomonas TaxID=196159 RepID=UPI00226AD0A4|nr:MULTISPECIES: hypothetical protein [unclassified Sphingomonas]